jgi:hypothetical protein
MEKVFVVIVCFVCGIAASKIGRKISMSINIEETLSALLDGYKQIQQDLDDIKSKNISSAVGDLETTATDVDAVSTAISGKAIIPTSTISNVSTDVTDVEEVATPLALIGEEIVAMIPGGSATKIGITIGQLTKAVLGQ